MASVDFPGNNPDLSFVSSRYWSSRDKDTTNTVGVGFDALPDRLSVGVQTRFKGSSQRFRVGVTVGDYPGFRQVSSSRGSCEVGYGTTVRRKRLWHATHIVTIPP
jgi:hypothetical protein